MAQSLESPWSPSNQGLESPWSPSNQSLEYPGRSDRLEDGLLGWTILCKGLQVVLSGQIN